MRNELDVHKKAIEDSEEKKNKFNPFSLNTRIQNKNYIKSDVINKKSQGKKSVGYEKNGGFIQTNREKKDWISFISLAHMFN